MKEIYTVDFFNNNNLKMEISDEELLMISALAEGLNEHPKLQTIENLLSYSKGLDDSLMRKTNFELILN